jgi:hypothetical protein
VCIKVDAAISQSCSTTQLQQQQRQQHRHSLLLLRHPAAAAAALLLLGTDPFTTLLCLGFLPDVSLAGSHVRQ